MVFFYKKINYSLNGINGIIKCGNEEISFSSPLIGEFNAENIISAASVGIALNIGLKNIENGINSLKVIDGRMEIFKTTDNKIDIRGVFPDTEVDTSVLPAIISIEPRELWIDNNVPILQIKMPYLFFSDTER